MDWYASIYLLLAGVFARKDWQSGAAGAGALAKMLACLCGCCVDEGRGELTSFRQPKHHMMRSLFATAAPTLRGCAKSVRYAFASSRIHFVARTHIERPRKNVARS